MADNAIIKILTALLKHQVKKVVGDEALGAIGQEIASIGGDKVDEQIKSWLGEETNAKELENAAHYAHKCFQDKVDDYELVQWMISLPLGDLPKVVEAIENLPKSPDEKELENALRESVFASWKKLSPEQIDKAIISFLSCLRIAILPIQKQTLMVIGRSVLRTEDKVDLLLRWFDQYIIQGKTIPIKEIDSEPAEYWNLKHPYAMPPNFTGRLAERKMLVDWLQNDTENRLFILCALGGFGKSALAWHWLTHDVNAKDWPRVVWWSFYEGDANFENFIRETLEYLNVDVPPGQRQQVDALLKAMSTQKILLIMDGFERALRAYSSMNAAYQEDSEPPSPLGGGGGVGGEGENQRDCVNLNAEIFLKNLCVLPNIKSKVLMTTRLTPRAVEGRGELLSGCYEVELQAMQKADAVAFFRAQGIRGGRAEIEAACEPYGYHPLSLRILAGLIANDRESPGDIAVANKLDIADDVIQNKHHVLEVAYNTLSPEQQKLLSHIACFRSTMSYDALKTVSDKDINSDLRILENRSLLHWDKTANKYDLHPIVRRYAYDRLTDKKAIHSRLRNYFANIPIQEPAMTVRELAPVIELFHHCVHAGRYREALLIFQDRLNRPLYIIGGEYILCVELLENLLSVHNNRISYDDPRAESWLLNKLALSYNRMGRSKDAELTFRKQIKIRENMGYLSGVAIGLGNLSEVLLKTGQLKNAAKTLQRKIDITKQIGNQSREMAGRQDYGLVLAYQGNFEESNRQQQIAISWLSKRTRAREESVSWVFITILNLLRGHKQEALDSANRANHLVSIEGRKRDIVRVQWLLGAAHRINGQLDSAEQLLSKALMLDRTINLVELEANILLDFARLRYAQEKPEEAKALAEEALLITERSGYVLQGADVHLFLAELALAESREQGVESSATKAKARKYAERALELAYCDGPPYYYKVAYEEAERFLENL